jgi:predicted ArsR family transcriptional regulator
MPDDLLSRAFRVADRKAAAAFSDPLRRRLVLLLAGQKRSAGELASVTGVELKRLHYHLAALEKLGLVVVAARRARAGRPVKLYRAVADAFFVPAETTAASPSDALAAELREARAKHADLSHEGILYGLGDGGKF